MLDVEDDVFEVEVDVFVEVLVAEEVLVDDVLVVELDEDPDHEQKAE